MKKFTELNQFEAAPELTVQEKIEAALNHLLAVQQNVATEDALAATSISNISEAAKRIATFIEINESIMRYKTTVEVQNAVLEGRKEFGITFKARNYYKVDLTKIDESVKTDVLRQLEAGNGYVDIFEQNETNAHVYAANTDNYLYSTIIVPLEALTK